MTMKKLRIGSALGAAAVCRIFGLILSEPAAYSQPASGTQPFEVVSVRPTKSRTAEPRMSPSPGGLVAENVTLRMLIRAAYRMDESSMKGGPGWLDTECYDVVARTAARSTEDQLRLILQRLLADRFQLRVHRETKEGPAYSLTIAGKNGPKLQPADAAGCAAPKPNPCGSFRKSGGSITGERVSMAELAHFLGSLTGLPVTDDTGVPGVFNLSFQAAIQDGVSASNGRESTNAAADTALPSLFTALRDQLGLKLERARGVGEILVIDSANKPLEN